MDKLPGPLQQSGAVEACWAHNPEVRGSKPRSAIIFLFVLLFHVGVRGREKQTFLKDKCAVEHSVISFLIMPRLHLTYDEPTAPV